MHRHRFAALWFLFCTLLSVFNVCTIYIFDGFDKPFYAVTANALVSLCGIVYHMHADETSASQGSLKRSALNAIYVINSV